MSKSNKLVAFYNIIVNKKKIIAQKKLYIKNCIFQRFIRKDKKKQNFLQKCVDNGI